ncbi:Scavenger receptor cysteine-rich type 1 protein M130, partial [Geodia barretti]
TRWSPDLPTTWLELYYYLLYGEGSIQTAPCPNTRRVIFSSVVCRQLGLGNDSAIPIGVTTDTMFGAGPSTQPILITNVVCSGNESNIAECSHSDMNSVGHCLHVDDVGVICE